MEIKRVDFRMPKSEWRVMNRACNRIGCDKSKYIRASIRFMRQQPDQVAVMRQMNLRVREDELHRTI